MKVQDAIKGYLLDGQVRNLSEKTLIWYKQKLHHLAAVLEEEQGVTELEQVLPAHLRAFVLRVQQTKSHENNPMRPTQEKGVSLLTVKGYVQVLKTFFAWCVEEELLSSSPAQRLKLPKVPAYLVMTVTTDQLHEMLAACDTKTRLGFRDYVLLLVLLDTGVRVSELQGLTIDQVQEDYIVVFGKGRKEREIGISPEVRKLLWKYLAKYRHPATPAIREVFLNRWGEPLTVNGIEQIVRRIKERAGVDKIRVSPHTFRHTFARMFLERGGEVYRLSRLMGHTDVKVTEKYLKDFTSREARQGQSRFSPVEGLGLNRTKRTRKGEDKRK